jgi:inner membrane transporter RhtA
MTNHHAVVMSAASLSSPTRISAPGAAALVLCSVVSLQVGAALSRHLFPAVGASGASLLRLGLAAIVLLALTRPKAHRWTRQQWRGVAALGVAMAGMNGLFYEAVARLPLGAAVTIQFMGPLALAAVLGRGRRELAWVVLALGGVAVLGLTQAGSGGSVSLGGVAFAAGAALFWALYILAGSRVAAGGVGIGGLAVATAISACVVAPAGIASGGAELLSAPVLAGGLVVALLASVIPYSCELSALRVLPRQTFSVLLALEPAAGAVAGAVILGQHLTLLHAAAIGAVVAAGIGSTLTASTLTASGQYHDNERGDGRSAQRGASRDHAPRRRLGTATRVAGPGHQPAQRTGGGEHGGAQRRRHGLARVHARADHEQSHDGQARGGAHPRQRGALARGASPVVRRAILRRSVARRHVVQTAAHQPSAMTMTSTTTAATPSKAAKTLR